jgi:hypothetical protein
LSAHPISVTSGQQRQQQNYRIAGAPVTASVYGSTVLTLTEGLYGPTITFDAEANQILMLNAKFRVMTNMIMDLVTVVSGVINSFVSNSAATSIDTTQDIAVMGPIYYQVIASDLTMTTDANGVTRNQITLQSYVDPTVSGGTATLPLYISALNLGGA